jgi:hypothetical protein
MVCGSAAMVRQRTRAGDSVSLRGFRYVGSKIGAHLGLYFRHLMEIRINTTAGAANIAPGAAA